MVGFGNIAVHEYQQINLEIVRMIIETRLADIQTFTKNLLQATTHHP